MTFGRGSASRVFFIYAAAKTLWFDPMTGAALVQRNEPRSGLIAEIRVAWARTWGGRLLPLLLAGVALLVVVQRLVTPAPAGVVHGELGRLAAVNETVGFALMVGALVSAYRLLSFDLSSEFESLSSRGSSGALTFTAGRLVVGAGGLGLAAIALGLVVEVFDLSGRYQREEAVHVATMFVNAVPLLMLAMVLTCTFGRIVGMIASVVMLNLGADAAYQRAALADGFIAPSGLYSIEEAVGWLLPRPLVDPFTGLLLMDKSVALQQFPVRQGTGVWGWDLIQVSGQADIALFAAYLLALAALFYVACRWRSAQAHRRFVPIAEWLEGRG